MTNGYVRRGLAALLAAVVILCGGGSAQAVTLSSDYEEPTNQIIPPPPPPPPPPPRNPVARLVSQVEVLPPYHYRGLAVFPLRLRHVEDPTNYLSMDEAAGYGWLQIKEKPQATVPELFVSNTGRRPIFLMAGELLWGGRQNRTLRKDMLLLPGARHIPAPVYCIEQRRWTGKTGGFGSGNALAGTALRQQIAGEVEQSRVWKQVEADARANRVSSKSGDLGAVYQDRAVQGRMEEYAREIKRRLPRDIVGLVAVERSHIVSSDIFCNPRLFEKLKDKLLSSCVVHPVRELSMHKVPDREDVRRFLRRVYRAGVHTQPSPGGGERVTVSGAGIMGNGLSYEGSVIHVSLFPGYAIMDPEPRPIIRPRQGER